MDNGQGARGGGRLNGPVLVIARSNAADASDEVIPVRPSGSLHPEGSTFTPTSILPPQQGEEE